MKLYVLYTWHLFRGADEGVFSTPEKAILFANQLAKDVSGATLSWKKTDYAGRSYAGTPDIGGPVYHIIEHELDK